MKRFELEEKIQAAWGTKEDIELVVRDLLDNPTEDTNREDRIANALIGISTVHDMKCQELFHLFEDMVKNGNIE